jgi:hypothetical protein
MGGSCAWLPCRRGWWMPGRRPRTVDVRRGGGLGWSCSDDSMGCGHGLARLGWRVRATWVASSSARPTRRGGRCGWQVGAAAPDLLARRSWSAGGRLGSLGYRSSTPCGVAARLRAGDVGAAAPGLVVCVWSSVVSFRVGDEAPTFVRFFRPVSLINSATLYGFWARFP